VNEVSRKEPLEKTFNFHHVELGVKLRSLGPHFAIAVMSIICIGGELAAAGEAGCLCMGLMSLSLLARRSAADILI
jgi:hypothetical protein